MFIENEVKIINHQKLILGDCLPILKTFADKIFDTIVTSPPYNLGIQYKSYSDNLEFKNYLKWLKFVFSECKRVLKDDGSLFLNIGGSNVQPWVPYDVLSILRDIFILQNDIIWVKSISLKNQSHGHYKPINSKRFLNHMYEHIFHLTKDGNVEIDRKAIGVQYVYKCNLKAVTVTEDVRCRGNTWFIPYETIHNKKQKGTHPAIFPVQLVEWCIKLANSKNVLDPFVGSGTTLVACQNLQVNGIGIEIDKEYLEFAKDRLETIKTDLI